MNTRLLMTDPAAGVAAFLTASRSLADIFDSDETRGAYLAAIRQPNQSASNADWGGEISELSIGPGLRVRVYVPRNDRPLPVIVYFHGGGWVSGDLDMHDHVCRALASGVEATVVNVGYRLAPEFPFPAPFDDALAATRWAHDRAGEYSGDPDRLILVGSSAGGNLAMAVAAAARDGGPEIRLQVLLYPVVDSRMSSESIRRFADGFGLSARQLAWFWDAYVPDAARRDDPRASPAHGSSLAALPPTLVITAGLDALKDEGEQYVRRILAEGGDAVLAEYPGQIHGFVALVGRIPQASEALEELISWILDRLKATPTRHPYQVDLAD